MARKDQLDIQDGLDIIVRAAEPEIGQLFTLLFSRYPVEEWATFAQFGWRETDQGLVITLATLTPPGPGDLDRSVSHVAFQEPYTLRTALQAETHSFAIGVIHSHPQAYRTEPSWIDDDMDGYFSDYFEGFAPERPYVSLIFAHNGQQYSGTGRVFWKGQWHPVRRFVFEGHAIAIGGYEEPRVLNQDRLSRLARLESAFGIEAAERLAQATVAVIGASGTGSPVIELLARAGIGHLIVVDPDIFSDSNLERVHGSGNDDIGSHIPKAELARRHVLSINPDCQVTAIQGALPQPEVVDAVVRADVMIGCTDKYYSRLAISDLSARYLIPSLDCGVGLEGESGQVTGQIIQIVRFLPSDPCAYCRKMIAQARLNQELMSEDERKQRRAAAQDAELKGENGNIYWHDEPQLNTVGYLTTATGSIAAGFAIGWITGRFEPPFSRLQMNLSQPFFDITDNPVTARSHCSCRLMRGTADQGETYAFLSAPHHWQPAKFL